MKRKNAIAIFMIAIMALSVCTAINITTATRADALIGTKLTVSYFPLDPLRNQHYAIYGKLTLSDGRTPLPKKEIKISWRDLDDHRTGKLKSVRTDSQGFYITKDSHNKGKRFLYTVTFPGDKTYAKAERYFHIDVGVSVLSFTLATPEKDLKNGQYFKLSGRLWQQQYTMVPIQYAAVKLYKLRIGPNTVYSQGFGSGAPTYKVKETQKTNDKGDFTFYDKEDQGMTVYYYAEFPGNKQYHSSKSRIISITFTR